jgi:CBS-domain-containing membrane protein
MEKKKVKDMVIPLSDYPHLPYWGTLKEAIIQLNVAYEAGHHTVLIFDESDKLVGILLEREILKGIEPKFAQHYEDGVSILWDELLNSGIEKQLERPIKEFMSSIKASVDGNDTALKASHIMLHDSVYLLPVMDGDKVIGVVRMRDLFQELTKSIAEM